jgi:hypothetical protein
MRAATVIVGAIAAASILIALAFILSPGDGSSTSGTTTVVRTTVGAAKPAPEESVGAEGEGAARPGGPKPCEGGEYTVEETSCQVGSQIHEAYEGGRRGALVATDETGAALTFLCKDETEPITCTGEDGGVVYFGG